MATGTELRNIRKKIERGDTVIPRILSALGDVNRFKIFKVFSSYRDICVSDLAHILDISVSAASQHLKILELAGIIKKKKIKKMVCYEIRDDNPVVKHILKIVKL